MTTPHDFELEKFKQVHQAAIDSNLRHLYALFLMNGAAATALLAQSDSSLKWGAIFFASGAILSILILRLNHLFYLGQAHILRGGNPEDIHPNSIDRKVMSLFKISFDSVFNDFGTIRSTTLAICFLFVIVFFCVGCAYVAIALSNMPLYPL